MSTLEHKVNTHMLAHERRKAGLPVWDLTIDIKSLLAEDPENETDKYVFSLAGKIAAKLRMPLNKYLDEHSGDYDEDISCIVGNFESLATGDIFAQYTAVEDFNENLSELYNWCANRVWTGP